MTKIIKETLSKQVYDILKTSIIQQKIPCGTKMTLKALQEQFGLSSTPIREAIKILSNEGLIDDVTNIGAKVISFGKCDIEEIYNFCIVLDTAALRFAANNLLHDDFIAAIKLSIEKQKEALDKEMLEDFIENSDQFHDLLFVYAHNSRLYDASRRIRSQLSILTTMYQTLSVSKSVVLVEHTDIAREIANCNLENATHLLKRHLEHERDYLLNGIVKKE